MQTVLVILTIVGLFPDRPHILASISEESDNSAFKIGLPDHYEGILMKITGYNYFLKHLLA